MTTPANNLMSMSATDSMRYQAGLTRFGVDANIEGITARAIGRDTSAGRQGRRDQISTRDIFAKR